MSVPARQAVRLAHVQEVFPEPGQCWFGAVPIAIPDRVVPGGVKGRSPNKKRVERDHVVHVGKGKVSRSEAFEDDVFLLFEELVDVPAERVVLAF